MAVLNKIRFLKLFNDAFNGLQIIENVAYLIFIRKNEHEKKKSIKMNSVWR